MSLLGAMVKTYYGGKADREKTDQIQQTRLNRLVRYAEFVDGPDEITLKENGEVDQLTEDLVLVYKDGTIQYPIDVPELEWLSAAEEVYTLSRIRLKVRPAVPEINTMPVPEGA